MMGVERADHAADSKRRRPRVTRASVTRAREAAFAELAGLADRTEDGGVAALAQALAALRGTPRAPSAPAAPAGEPAPPEGLTLAATPVRGHLRRQPHGPGASLRRWQWVEGYEARRWVAPLSRVRVRA